MSAERRTIEVRIDGRAVRARDREWLLPLARRSGAFVPSLCHEDGIEPYAACRLCLVEVNDGRRKRIVTSCDYPVRDGIEVVTKGDRVEAMRRSMMRLILARAPGSSELRALAGKLGVDGPGQARTADPAELCILCGLCVRVCSELAGAHAIGMAGRGHLKRIELPYAEGEARECIACGACAAVCPTRCIEVEPIAIERLRRAWGAARPCRYALMGLLPGALCAHDYDCRSCPTDHEMFDRAGGRHPAFMLAGRRAKALSKDGVDSVDGDAPGAGGSHG